jgi:hypothetical protein
VTCLLLLTKNVTVSGALSFVDFKFYFVSGALPFVDFKFYFITLIINNISIIIFIYKKTVKFGPKFSGEFSLNPVLTV